MIIEFFGFPGSGKTTICNKFIKKLKKDDRKVIRGTFDHLGSFKRITFKLFYSFLCLFISPKFYTKNLLFFLEMKSGRKTAITDFLNVSYLYARYSVLKKTEKIVVFDQGLIQAYWSVFTFTEAGREYDYHLLFKNIEMVIILEMDLGQNIERLFSREDKRSRVQKKTENIDIYFKKFLIVKDTLSELSIQHRLYLDSGRKVKKNVRKIKKKMVTNKAGNTMFQNEDNSN